MPSIRGGINRGLLKWSFAGSCLSSEFPLQPANAKAVVALKVKKSGSSFHLEYTSKKHFHGLFMVATTEAVIKSLKCGSYKFLIEMIWFFN